MKNKFSKEKYITHQKRENRSDRFLISINYKNTKNETKRLVKSVNINKYESISVAFESAKLIRDTILIERNIIGTNNLNITFFEVFERKFSLFPKSPETTRKHHLLYKSYLSHLSDCYFRHIKVSDLQLSLNEARLNSTQDKMNRLFSLIKEICRTAIMIDVVNIDYSFKLIKPKPNMRPKTRVKTVSDNVITQVLSLLEDSKLKEKSQFIFLIKLIYYTGLRPAEALALTIDDIDLNSKLIHVNKAISLDEQRMPIIGHTKTEFSTRSIPINEHLAFEFIKYLENVHFYLFEDNNGLLSSTKVSDQLRKILKPKDIQFNLYALRHRFSTDQITSNTDLRTVQELMGHANASMTLDYARSNNDLKIKAINNKTKLE